MKLTVRLFIQKHQNRTYTVTVPDFPGIAAYGPTLEECKQEVAEALEKRLAEMDPDTLYLFALRPNQSLERVTVELRPTDRHGKRRRNSFQLTISLLLTPEEDGQILVSAPRLRHPPLAFYIAQREELEAVARLELAQYFYDESFERLLLYRAARQETIDALEVKFKPKKAADKLEEEEDESFWALRQSGINLTAQAGEGQLRRAYRREQAVEEVVTAIASERRPNILLVGPEGVGKSVIAHEVARRIRRRECAELLHDRQVWAVSGETLIAGCTYIGQWQEKLNDIVREVRKKRHILFVTDIASLTEAGRWSKSDENMADFLKPHMQSGDVIIIGETTQARLRRAEQLVPGFVALFRTLQIEPTGEADTLSILTAVGRELERSEDVRIEPAALEAAVELTNRFLPYRAQPGKAVILLEQVAGDANRRRSTTTGAPRPVLTRREVITTFTRQTGLPEFILSDLIPLDLAAVQTYFADRVIGQAAAVQAMVDLIAIIKAGLNDPEKPLGTFLFIGPTGVGKTQLAKTLAKYLFGAEERLVRFDMSEYADPAGVRRLIGMPGAGRDGGEGELTGKVRAQPFCVLLLDEFEKADHQIYDVFLQVLGEGRLTDAAGQTTSFQNAIILLTSNLGASAREQRNIGLSARSEGPGLKTAADDEPLNPQSTAPGTSSYWQRKIEDYFRPEFVNRIDQIVAFTPLDDGAMRQIARRELGEVLMREGLVRRNVLVEIDDNVIDLLAERGFNATYGARPLKRAIERLLVLPLARFLASRERPGADLLRLHREDDQIVLRASGFAGAERSSEVLLSAGDGALSEGARRRRLDDRGLADAFAEIRRKLQDWTERDAIVEMNNERATLLAETNKPTFWDDGDAARSMLARFYFLDRLLKRLQQLIDRVEYLEELAGLVHRQRDPRYRAELAESYERLHRDYAFLDVELLCAHLTGNHRAVLLLRRVGTPARGEDVEAWLTQLATMYLRWAQRKGYDIDLAVLEPLSDAERQGNALIPTYYPYRWRSFDTSDMDAAIKHLTALDEISELAIGLEGTNVYGFLKGETGLHRRNDRRPSGERVQRLAEVRTSASGDLDTQTWLEKLLLQRAWEEQDLAGMTRKQRAALPKPAEPEIIRVYQVDGDRFVRDLRTHVKTSDVSGVLEGSLDDFILAYLREEEAKRAWQEEGQ
jgi:ATP-dependent Clp protease ATP-binding subunit ClpA/protein subunit release factor A